MHLPGGGGTGVISGRGVPRSCQNPYPIPDQFIWCCVHYPRQWLVNVYSIPYLHSQSERVFEKDKECCVYSDEIWQIVIPFCWCTIIADHTKPCHIPDKTTLKRKTLPHGTYPYSIDRGVPFPPNTPSPLSAGCTTVTQHLVIVVVVHQEMHLLIAFKTLLSISAKSMSKYVSLKQLWRRIMAIINTCIWSIYEVKNYFLLINNSSSKYQSYLTFTVSYLLDFMQLVSSV